ncbi:YggS family pyridoxal phosphate-dependent enzyme [Schumannella sp. 10F1B-5-1]|uniref:YggS family pyridoxal phosphate-dependent enzyme n=1 Tax=Schumannella sp. 10F1B-5-1 TaxID=2590780 RepID=UPI001131C75E|nr:YggS family pyridoxal phosphate-dependent enzyme [Schumannella sp. 10F1B-5-1]TPW73810.1 YggS family pyridoxal phosphate-dependent enzyme [Schumannella sp. 10F1B-5-1]
MSELAERLAATDARIADAARAAGRDPAELTRIVVTKFHPASLVRELAGLGVRDVGESRHQEAGPKAAELADLDLVWHFVGQLQSKKARQVRDYAHVIHSLDRASVVDALAAVPGSAGPLVDGFLQVDLSGEPGRGGVAPADVAQLAERILHGGGVRLVGVMAVAPLGEEPRPAFARLREVSERLQTLAPDARAISAGMSGDYAEAILEGATHLRIGTAITGKRPDRG